MNNKGLGARPMVMGMLTIGLVMLCLFYFALSYSTVSNDLMADSRFSEAYVDLNDSLSGMQGQSSAWYEAIESDEPSLTFVFLILASIVSVPKAIFGAMIGLSQVFLIFIYETLLSPQAVVVMGVIMSMILITIIFIIIKVVRTGETER